MLSAEDNIADVLVNDLSAYICWRYKVDTGTSARGCPTALRGEFGGDVYGDPAGRRSLYIGYTLCWPSSFPNSFLGDGDRKRMVG